MSAERPIRVGLQLPAWGAAARRQPLIRVAREAEAAGFDSLWVSDHLVYPLGAPVEYPYSSTGEPPFTAADGYLEALTTLGVVAGATERIRLGTSVLILPMRPLLLTAKCLSTLDVLSDGRLVVAVSAGWWRAEFEALDVNFDRRGELLDAQLAALQALWADGRGSASGPDLAFPDVVLAPRPIQPGGPEVWIGGRGKRAWRRATSSGATGWHGIGYQGEAIKAAREGIARACDESGRDPSTVRYSTATGMPSTGDRLAARLDDLRSQELDQVVLIPRSDSISTLLEGIEQFGRVGRPMPEDQGASPGE
jgi:probable F420-dependent oxidoreductase